MRRFTKEHNELDWLYPDPSSNNESSSEGWFDLYEEQAKNLLQYGYGDQTEFSRDDMIDAFMKGASNGHQFLGGKMNRLVNSLEEHKRLNAIAHEEYEQLMALFKKVSK